MDKWEQVARTWLTTPLDDDSRDTVSSLAHLLRQCEANTVRRCAEAGASVFSGSALPGMPLVGQGVKETILALLPQEPAQ